MANLSHPGLFPRGPESIDDLEVNHESRRATRVDSAWFRPDKEECCEAIIRWSLVRLWR